MFEALFTNLSSRIKIDDEQFLKVAQCIKPLELKRKKDLVRKGEISRFIAFVESGMLRSYSEDDKRNEHVVQLAIENYWIGDLASFLSERPGVLTVEAIEPSRVLLIYHEDLERLYREIPVLERFFRILFSNAYVAAQERINYALSDSAEERYKRFMDNHAELALRVPLIHIASFLGITPESLSRIRRQMTQG